MKLPALFLVAAVDAHAGRRSRFATRTSQKAILPPVTTAGAFVGEGVQEDKSKVPKHLSFMRSHYNDHEFDQPVPQVPQ
jgi:hypothetical protein